MSPAPRSRLRPANPSPPSAARRVATAAIALAASVGVAVGLDPFGLIASASEETVAIGLVATEAVVAFLLLFPFVSLCLDLFDAWRRSAGPGARGSGDDGAVFGVWSTSESGSDGWSVSEGWGGHGGGDFGGGGDSGGDGGGGGD